MSVAVALDRGELAPDEGMADLSGEICPETSFVPEENCRPVDVSSAWVTDWPGTVAGLRLADELTAGHGVAAGSAGLRCAE